MKRDELKNLIKECLVEILAEGINLIPRRRTVESKPPQSQSHQTKKNNFIEEMITKKSENNSIKEGKGMMSSIFEDTIKNTLPKMSEVDREFGRYRNQQNTPELIEDFSGMSAEEITKKARPEQIFGEEISGNWSKLAFFESKNSSK